MDNPGIILPDRRQLLTSGFAAVATFYINKITDRSLQRLVRDNKGGTIQADRLGIHGAGGSPLPGRQSSAPNETAAINDAIEAISESLGGEGHNLRTRLLFPTGVYGTDGIIARSDVWLDFGRSVVKKLSNGHDASTNSVIRVIPKFNNKTFYGNSKNIRVSNGTFDPNGKSAPAHIFGFIYCEDLILENLNAIHRRGNSSWGFHIGGRRIQAKNINVYNGTDRFQDGIHIYHGEDIEVWPGRIESGDDCIAIGSEAADHFMKNDPDAIRRVTVHPCTVRSAVASCIKVYRSKGAPDAPSGDVEDIKIMGVKGVAQSGIAVVIRDYDEGGTVKNNRIRNVSISSDLALGSKADAGLYGLDVKQNGNFVWMLGASNITARLRLSDPSNTVSDVPKIGTIKRCTNINLNVNFKGAWKNHFRVIASDGVTLS